MTPMASSVEGNLRELYKCLPLDHEQSIRLLVLAPGSASSQIHVQLKVADLYLNPVYECLSYTWGASQAGRSILISGGHTVPVTDNLFNALRGLRERHKPRTLWIDQLCIDQSNVTERGSQVAIMDQIYAKATCVNVWLGEPASWTFPIYFSHVFSHVFHATKEGLTPGYIGIDEPQESRRHNTWRQWYDTEVRRGRKDSFKNHGRIILKALGNSEPLWYTRVWTVQEFVLAKEIYLCAGRRRWLYSSVWMRSFRDGPMLGLMKLSTAINGMDLLRLVRSRDPSGVLNATESPTKDHIDCLFRISDKRATDPRDFVYSLRALMNEREANILQPDYELPCSMLYARATYASIVSRENFDIFNFVDPNEPDYRYRSRSSLDAPLPSWCVHFGDRFRHTGIMDFGKHIRSKEQRFVAPKLSDDDRLLSIEAYFLGQVNARTMAIEPDYDRRSLDLATTAAKHLKFKLSHSDPSKVIQALRDAGSKDSTVSVEPNLPQRFFRGDNKLLYDVTLAWNDASGVRIPGPEPSRPYGSLNSTLFIYYSYARHFGTLNGTAIFATPDGVVCFGPGTLLPGDIIVHVCSQCPFIALRYDHEGGFYSFQGQVWVHGFMDNRTLERWTSLDVQRQTFVLG